MTKLLFLSIVFSAFKYFHYCLCLFIKFLSQKNGERKIDQDSLVGLALIFVTMTTMFLWVIYLSLLSFNNQKLIKINRKY